MPDFFRFGLILHVGAASVVTDHIDLFIKSFRVDLQKPPGAKKPGQNSPAILLDLSETLSS